MYSGRPNCGATQSFGENWFRLTPCKIWGESGLAADVVNSSILENLIRFLAWLRIA